MSETGQHEDPPDGVPAAPEPPRAVDGELVDDPATDPDPPRATGHSAPIEPAGDYTDAGLPTFDYVRDRIENRYATSTGATELAGESAQAGALDEQLADRDRAAREKLEQIRRSMRGE